MVSRCCYLLTNYICVFVVQSEGAITIRTRKFMTNRLLNRKQMVSGVTFLLRFDSVVELRCYHPYFYWRVNI